MTYAVLEKKLKSLPQSALEESSKKKGFGCLKDIPCKMAPDFDEPLEEFAEYI